MSTPCSKVSASWSRPSGPQLAGVRWLSGGTILPDGRVALILDALALLRSGAVQVYRPVTAAAEPTKGAICVMVVDDSLTVRRVTSRLLRRQNMEVLTAKDGVEALTLLDERMPDLLLLDIEMPRMDGYELARHIRRSEGLRDLPIIMITSRTGAKHREHAMDRGGSLPRQAVSGIRTAERDQLTAGGAIRLGRLQRGLILRRPPPAAPVPPGFLKTGRAPARADGP